MGRRVLSSQGTSTPRRHATAGGAGPGIDEDRGRSKEESSSDEIVLGSSWLSNDERVALEDDRSSYDRQMPRP